MTCPLAGMRLSAIWSSLSRGVMPAPVIAAKPSSSRWTLWISNGQGANRTSHCSHRPSSDLDLNIHFNTECLV
ncbi:hypothetical protein PF008_g28781 [Phytophthora fragariae]|uniref:Uncharacterized protein n=1 Tax=Phytophthora fragariae TaxID=53985 RepID=A0A6G0QAD5_9STRA|nr:hypothetical protein PF008_g28781 [Phytophthora fragariae]